jgi:hypothetical protein
MVARAWCSHQGEIMGHVQIGQHFGGDTRLCFRAGWVVLWCAAGVIGAGIGLGGCASEVPRYSSGLWVGDQGHANEVVFDGEAVALAREANGVEVAVAPWRDEQLSIRGPESAYEQAAWPDWRRPTLDRPGRVWFSTQTNSYVYFRQEGVQYRSERRYWVP